MQFFHLGLWQTELAYAQA